MENMDSMVVKAEGAYTGRVGEEGGLQQLQPASVAITREELNEALQSMGDKILEKVMRSIDESAMRMMARSGGGGGSRGGAGKSQQGGEVGERKKAGMKKWEELEDVTERARMDEESERGGPRGDEESEDINSLLRNIEAKVRGSRESGITLRKKKSGGGGMGSLNRGVRMFGTDGGGDAGDDEEDEARASHEEDGEVEEVDEVEKEEEGGGRRGYGDAETASGHSSGYDDEESDDASSSSPYGYKTTKLKLGGGNSDEKLAKVFDKLRAKAQNGGKVVPAWFGSQDALRLALMAQATNQGALFTLKGAFVKRVAKGIFGDKDSGIILEHLYVESKSSAGRIDPSSSVEGQDFNIKAQEGGEMVLRAKEAKLEIKPIEDARSLRRRLLNLMAIFKAAYPNNAQVRQEIRKLMEGIEHFELEYFEEKMPPRIVEFIAEEINSILRDWVDEIVRLVADAHKELAKLMATKGSSGGYSEKMERIVKKINLGCPKLEFRSLIEEFENGAKRRALCRLLIGGGGGGGGAGGRGWGQGGAGGNQQQGRKGGAGGPSPGNRKAAGAGGDAAGFDEWRDMFWDEKLKNYHCFESLQGRKCNKRECKFIHGADLPEKELSLMLKGLKLWKAQRGQKAGQPK